VLIYQNIVSLFVMLHAVQRNSRIFSGLLASLCSPLQTTG
jgi:hypothetical protein